jgi:hypothetical protein
LPSWPGSSGADVQVLRDARSQSSSLLTALQPSDNLVINAMHLGGEVLVFRLRPPPTLGHGLREGHVGHHPISVMEGQIDRRICLTRLPNILAFSDKLRS